MEEHNVCETTSRSAAAISLTFIVLVTPWAIQQVITSCTGTNVSNSLFLLAITTIEAIHAYGR